MRLITALLAATLAVPMIPARAATDIPDPFGTAAPEPSEPSAGQAQGAAPDPSVAPAPPLPAVGARSKPKSKSKSKLHADQANNHGLLKRNVAVPARLRAKTTLKPVNQLKVAEKAGFKKVSDLVNFPPFFPGLGIVTVKPDTLPVGPFRTFDRKGKLISTVYMLPLKDMDDHKKWDEVKGLPAPADHATFYFHPGHPGVDMPHYHLVIWHVSRKGENLVAQ